jgi:hypothetical protein
MSAWPLQFNRLIVHAHHLNDTADVLTMQHFDCVGQSAHHQIEGSVVLCKQRREGGTRLEFCRRGEMAA